jgi:hypothetical protein
MTGRFSQQNSDKSSSTNPAGASAMIVQKRRGRPRIVPESAAADFRLLKSSPIKPPLEGGGGRNNDDVYALDFFGDLDRQNEPVAKKKYKKSSSVKFKQQLTAANSSSKIYHPSSSVFPGNGVFYREERGGKAPPRDEEDPFHFSSASANTREVRFCELIYLNFATFFLQ